MGRGKSEFVINKLAPDDTTYTVIGRKGDDRKERTFRETDDAKIYCLFLKDDGYDCEVLKDSHECFEWVRQ